MTISAIVIADSISPQGKRLTTLQLRYPRMIHSELMTHKAISRSASSSRAIPVNVMIKQLLDDPAEPVSWGKNQKGMQAGEDMSGLRLAVVRAAWHTTKRMAIAGARVAIWAGLHKQVANRMLEPWGHISVVVTATDWQNFYTLRCHSDADPTFQALAEAIRTAITESKPERLDYNQWHLPYVSKEEIELYGYDVCLKLSAARCARVSYLNHDGKKPSVAADFKLYERLIESQPVHASPTEHQGKPDKFRKQGVSVSGKSYGYWYNPGLHGNFTGFIQHRKLIPNEYVPG